MKISIPWRFYLWGPSGIAEKGSIKNFNPRSIARNFQSRRPRSNFFNPCPHPPVCRPLKHSMIFPIWWILTPVKGVDAFSQDRDLLKPFSCNKLPKGPKRTQNTTAREKVNYYAVVFLLRPLYLQ